MALLTREQEAACARWNQDEDRWRRLATWEKRYVHAYRRRFDATNPTREEAFNMAFLALAAEESAIDTATQTVELLQGSATKASGVAG